MTPLPLSLERLPSARRLGGVLTYLFAAGCSGTMGTNVEGQPMSPPGAEAAQPGFSEPAAEFPLENPGKQPEVGPSLGGRPATGGGEEGAGVDNPLLDEEAEPVFSAGDPGAVGPMPLRRLNRSEYNFTVQDLLGSARAPADAFPSDRGSGFGFPRAERVSTLEAELLMEAADTLAGELSLSEWLSCEVDSLSEDCANEFIERFAMRAYRRPVTVDELGRLGSFYSQLSDELDLGAEEALRTLVSAVLQSPAFLYRWELGEVPAVQSGDAIALTGYELASRLSYLIWRSMPDAELLEAARSGLLLAEEELAVQADRLLLDERARQAMGLFVTEWLGTSREQIESRDKSPAVYPEFDSALHTAMAAEVRAFAESIIFDSEGTLAELLTSTRSWVQPGLLPIYGISGSAEAGGVQSVSLDSAQRSGLFTLPAFLTVTGAADGSNPVKRGHHIYKALLCHEVPPPSGIEIPPPEPPSTGGTTRERFARHSENPCAGCHLAMDPLGFAFEHYDGIGRFRETDNGGVINAASSYEIDGVQVSFNNATELMGSLADSAEVADCVATQWLRYGLDRKESPDDQPSLEHVVTRFSASGANLKTLVNALVTSRSFRLRTPAVGETVQ